MSITINIYYQGNNGSAIKFVNEMTSSGIVDKIRQESRNLRYEYFFSLQDKETVLLIDSWENQNALDNHHLSPMMKEITILREKYDLHMKVERYSSIEEDVNKEKYIRK